MLRLVLPALVLGLALPCVALAGDDEVVVSSSQAAKSLPKTDATKAADETQPATGSLPDQKQTVAWLSEAAKGSRSTRDAAKDAPASEGNFLSKHGIHGSAGVSVGTGGYSSAYVSALIPVGDDGLLGIAYSQTDFGNNAAYGYPGYGYGGYGHGVYGRGYPGYGYGQRGGRSQSFGLSYQSGFDDRHSDTPDGCAPGFRHDGHYVEPLWVSRMHGNQACDASEDSEY